MQSDYGPSHEEYQRLVDELIELKAEKKAREIIEAEQKEEADRKTRREAEEAEEQEIVRRSKIPMKQLDHEVAKWSKMTMEQLDQEFIRLSEIMNAIDIHSQVDTYLEFSEKVARLLEYQVSRG